MHIFINTSNDNTFCEHNTYHNLMNHNSFEHNLNNQDKIITSLEERDRNLYLKNIKIYYYFLISLEKILNYSIKQKASTINVHLSITKTKETISINDNSIGIKLINLNFFIKKNLLNIIYSNCKINLFSRSIMEIYGFNIVILNNQVTCEKAFKASSGTCVEIEVSINNNLITKQKIINCKCCYFANILHIQNKISIFSVDNFCKNKNNNTQKASNNIVNIKKKLNKFKQNNLNLLSRVDILKYCFMLIYFKAKYKNIMFYCTLEYNKQLLNF